MNKNTPQHSTVVVEPLDLTVPVDSALVSFSVGHSPAVLESSLPGGPSARFSILACDPIETITIDSCHPGCPLQALADRVAAYPRVDSAGTHPPFTGGWIGYIAYEAGLRRERISCTNTGDPLPHQLRFALYDSAAVFDHERDTWYAVAVDWQGTTIKNRPPVRDRISQIRRRIESTGEVPPVASPATSQQMLAANMDRRDYYRRVKKAKRYIEAGDIYQVNLTQRITTQTSLSPTDLYRRLREHNPSSHAALLSYAEGTIISSSPELFLDLRNGRVVTRPIKGTRPRGANALEDIVLRRELADSEKDRAELNMIIDLLRNDLGRVCAYGSVKVREDGLIETHPTVLHRTATIEGELAANRNWFDLLQATFPGGSVTGAPKIRAMQIIDELEPTARGVYCGSIGYIGLDGNMCMNIAIRTMVQTGSTVHLYVGGAIVADSNAEEEYAECAAKAEGMLRALGYNDSTRLASDRPPSRKLVSA